MAETRDPFDDGLGPDPLDRGSGKLMGGGGGGGGSDIDPSYDDALRIMGRGHEMPSPWEQRALTMDNPEAAELARRLTALRRAAGADLGSFAAPTLGAPAEGPSTGQVVQEFIAALQEAPPDPQQLADLRRQIAGGEAEVQTALNTVCEHAAVQARLAGEDRS